MIWDSIFRHPAFAKTEPIKRDPLTIGVSLLVNLGYTGAISGFGATLFGSAVLGAAAFGLTLVSNALFAPRPPAPAPSERQATIRQSIGPRLRNYGRVKVGGTLFFFANHNENLYQGVTLNEGRIYNIVEIWINDQSVAIDPATGLVTTPPYVLDDGTKVVRFLFKLGAADQTAHDALVTTFPDDWTEFHRLRGVANYLAIFQEVPRDKIGEVYPQLNPNVRMVVDASMVKSVRTGLVVFSSNPADCIYDYLTGRDEAGFAYGPGYDPDNIDLLTFQNFANLSDQNIPLRAGGTIRRYKLWGGFALNEEMRDVLPRMLATCDGELYLTTEGKIGIRGGQWVEPELTLDDTLGHILSGEFQKGARAMAAFNELTITYLEPRLDYQETEAQPWVDGSNVALRGRVVPSQLDLPMVPHHAQARRLGKIYTHKNNPEWSGKIVTNLYGFNALNERFIRVKYSPLGIDAVFLVRRVTILPDMTGLELQISSMTAGAYEWDADLEEGAAPNQPSVPVNPASLPPPDDIVVTVGERVVSGVTVGLFLRAMWTEPARTALSQEARYRIAPSGDWFNMSVSDGVGRAESGIISEGSTYQVQVRTLAPAGTPGPWSAIYPIFAEVIPHADTDTVTADSTAYTADRT